jgi:hypothetical protein
MKISNMIAIIRTKKEKMVLFCEVLNVILFSRSKQQYRQTMASSLISSAQYLHFFIWRLLGKAFYLIEILFFNKGQLNYIKRRWLFQEN